MTVLRPIVILLAALLLMGLTTRNEERLDDPAQEAEAMSIMEELRCLVCQSQSIANSDADLAMDLRQIVRERVLAGDSPDEVKAYLQARYGDWVLLKPPVKNTTYLLWLAPGLLLVGGGIILFNAARRQKRAASGLDDSAAGSDDIL